MDDDLDQVLTSAAAAMTYAVADWAGFCAYLPYVTGDPVPVSRDQMREHAAAVCRMADPARMGEDGRGGS